MGKVRSALARAFDQEYLRAKPGFRKMPALRVRLKGEGGSIDLSALVDSGSSITVIPKEIATAMEPGIHREAAASKVETGGGRVVYDFSRARFEVLDDEGMRMWGFGGQVRVPRAIGAPPFVVLGRDYLFNAYDLTFRERKRLLELRPAMAPATRE